IALAIAATGLGAGCAAKRFLGFGGDGTLLVRHHESAPQEIWLEGELLGVVDSAAVACFRATRTGTVRVEARAASAASAPASLTRAASVVLPPDQPHLAWALENLVAGHVVNRIAVDPETARWAKLALDRMLTVR
ncbi:MAG TPA: hypothetical protein VFH11_13485, partial [Gemmatimonadota bacterium]|nr:hypothetical protein [Gemmatimonadota bacterium]